MGCREEVHMAAPTSTQARGMTKKFEQNGSRLDAVQQQCGGTPVVECQRIAIPKMSDDSR